MEALKGTSHLYEIEGRASHAERPGFRFNAIQISPTLSMCLRGKR